MTSPAEKELKELAFVEGYDKLPWSEDSFGLYELGLVKGSDGQHVSIFTDRDSEQYPNMHCLYIHRFIYVQEFESECLVWPA